MTDGELLIKHLKEVDSLINGLVIELCTCSPQKREMILMKALSKEATKKQPAETKKIRKSEKMKLKLVKGGQYEPSTLLSPLLSEDFKAWWQA